MFRAFRTRFPTGSLVSELVDIERGMYVVRACVQHDGTTLASGFAAATTIEAAEDAARARAIAAAGLDLDAAGEPVAPPPTEMTSGAPAAPSYVPDGFNTPAAPVSDPTPASFPDPIASEPAPAAPRSPDPVASEPAPAAPRSPSPTAAPDAFDLPAASDWQGFVPSSSNSAPDSNAAETQANWWDTPDPLPVLDPPAESRATSQPASQPAPAARQPAKPAKPAAKASESKPAAKPAASKPAGDSTEYSDIIARTSVELKRLRWTNEQGRKFLEETYGKRSRQLLDEGELREFLAHLESQPTPR